MRGPSDPYFHFTQCFWNWPQISGWRRFDWFLSRGPTCRFSCKHFQESEPEQTAVVFFCRRIWRTARRWRRVRAARSSLKSSTIRSEHFWRQINKIMRLNWWRSTLAHSDWKCSSTSSSSSVHPWPETIHRSFRVIDQVSVTQTGNRPDLNSLYASECWTSFSKNLVSVEVWICSLFNLQDTGFTGFTGECMKFGFID